MPVVIQPTISRFVYLDDVVQVGATMTVVCNGVTYTATSELTAVGALAEVELPDSDVGETATVTVTYSTYTATETVTVSLTGDMSNTYLHTAALCSVTVTVETDEGEIAGGAKVTISGTHTGTTNSTIGSADYGKVTISDIAAGTRSIQVVYDTDNYEIYEGTITVTNGAAITAVVNSRTHWINVFVTPASSDAVVTLTGDSTYTDTTSSGEASLEVTNGNYTLSVAKTGYETYIQLVNITEYTEVSVTLTQSWQSGTITVQNNSSHAAVSGATVTVAGIEYTTNSSGQCSVMAPEDETSEIEIVKDGYDTTLSSVTPSSEQLAWAMTIPIIPDNAYSTVTITVQNESGDALPDATVSCGGVSAVTNSSGVATLRLLYASLPYYRITVACMGYYRKTVTVSSTATVTLKSQAQTQASQIIAPCDIIIVRHPLLDINVSAKVVEEVYDVLRERVNSIELGAKRAIMYNEPSDDAAQALATANAAMTTAQSALEQIAEGETRSGTYEGESGATGVSPMTVDGCEVWGIKYNNAIKNITISGKPKSVMVFPLYTERTSSYSNGTVIKSVTEYHKGFCGMANIDGSANTNGISLDYNGTDTILSVSNPDVANNAATMFWDKTVVYYYVPTGVSVKNGITIDIDAKQKDIGWNCSASCTVSYDVTKASYKETRTTRYGWIAFY